MSREGLYLLAGVLIGAAVMCEVMRRGHEPREWFTSNGHRLRELPDGDLEIVPPLVVEIGDGSPEKGKAHGCS